MLISLALHVDCILDNYTGCPKQAQEVQEEGEEEERGRRRGSGCDDNTTNVKRFTHKYISREWKILIYPLWQ